MADSLRIDIDAKRFRAAVDRLGKKVKPELLKGLRKGANILKKEIQKDYRGRVLKRETGRLAKSVTVRKGRDRGNIISMVVRPKSFLARLHEKGYTINPIIKNRKRLAAKVGQPVRVKIGGRWITLKNRTHVPGKHIVERQIDRQEPKVWGAVREFLRKTIREAGLG